MKLSQDALNRLIACAHYYAQQMIFTANARPLDKGEPKVGGHASASSSALHIMAALHLFVKSGHDIVANKPHASPMDHSLNYMLSLLLDKNLNPLPEEVQQKAMGGLRAYGELGEVFQSYHSHYDADHFNFLPSGTVGIPAVAAGYLALAYRFAKAQGYKVPGGHFWCVLGDAEFREGSLLEAAPDLAERGLGELTWIVDYNRQSLDGHRTPGASVRDSVRIAQTMQANGWHVVDLQHGPLRKKAFASKGGAGFKNWLEALPDYELQVLLNAEPKKITSYLKKHWFPREKALEPFVKAHSAEQVKELLLDFAGHDIKTLNQAFLNLRNKKLGKPSCVIAHTLKGWGLDMKAASGNHSMLPKAAEIARLKVAAGFKKNAPPFVRMPWTSPEGQFLKARGAHLLKDFREQNKLRQQNLKKTTPPLELTSLGIPLKFAVYPHTQWMLGQCIGKLARLADSNNEQAWQRNLCVMAPDVGTSTNLSMAMDARVLGPESERDFYKELGVMDPKNPNLLASQSNKRRFLRFDITEANSTSCLGAFGQMRRHLGAALLPVMTVYDFFIKRALDQYFYNLYWGSSFILVGTPSGVSLSAEGAQHCWKSDLQIPNQIVWEPFYCQELDWILCESIRLLLSGQDQERSGVLLRATTQGADQKEFLTFLKQQKVYKKNPPALLALKGEGGTQEGVDESQVEPKPQAQILQNVRQHVLKGGYFLRCFAGYAHYRPGENVVHILAMGALCTEALKASKALFKKGVYANVLVVTSPSLLCGNLGAKTNYAHLCQNLGLTGDWHAVRGKSQSWAEAQSVVGGRVPVVSVHDGEPGLLDNVGSILGVKQVALAVRRHSVCGRAHEVYRYHGLDAHAIEAAAWSVLERTASEKLKQG